METKHTPETIALNATAPTYEQMLAHATNMEAQRDALRAQNEALVMALTTLYEAVRTYHGEPKGGATHPKFFDGPMLVAESALSDAKSGK